MRIVVDQDIPGAAEAFAPLGEVRAVGGRGLGPESLAEADALIVRSVTRVDANLLARTAVRFVGTVTSGTDHVDLRYLADRGIAFASAAGCNAETVSQYVFTAIAHLADRLDFDPRGRTLGVVGVGRIGARVARWAEAVGMRVLRCDPPRVRQGLGVGFVDIETLLSASDVVTLHVPLTRDGPDATFRLIGPARLSRMKLGAILINTARGDVIDEPALLASMRSGRHDAVVLDVWHGEPAINSDVAEAVAVATPHVAGYSVEARRRGLAMIVDALRLELSGASGDEATAETQPPPKDALPRDAISVTPSNRPWHAIAQAAFVSCPLLDWDAGLRTALRTSDASDAFEQLRRRCTARREFGAYPVSDAQGSVEAVSVLRAVGFMEREESAGGGKRSR